MYKFTGYTGIVWNPKNNKNLCTFKNGCFETEDKGVAKMLIKLGYHTDDVIEEEVILEKEVPETEEAEEKINLRTLSYSELKSMAKDKNIKGYHLMSTEKLIEALEG